jgi:multidrug resistance efflux pump
MPVSDERFRALLEKLDPKVKLRRLEEELDGNEQKGLQGLREQLLSVFRQYEAQKRLVKQRVDMRSTIAENQHDLFDQKHAVAELNLKMLEAECDLIAQDIEITEAQVAAIKSAGLTPPSA